jgi:hypothetical protein
LRQSNCSRLHSLTKSAVKWLADSEIGR